MGIFKFCRKSGEFAHSIAAVVRDPARNYARAMLGAVAGAPIMLPQTSRLALAGETGPSAWQRAIASTRGGGSSWSGRGLGVVGFVFEGRPNVFADGAGVLRSGNTVVFRIGSDALGTARAIVEHALDPALAGRRAAARGGVAGGQSPSTPAGWALFSDPRLSLAVARGSGPAVAQLGAVARQAGLPVSLHGTGGAWIVASPAADPDVFAAAVLHSLDRKVCNTLNTCCVVAAAPPSWSPCFLDALDEAGERRGAVPSCTSSEGSEACVPEPGSTTAPISRAGGRRRGAAGRAAGAATGWAGVGVGGQPRGDPGDRARRGHRGAAVQPAQPALHRQPDRRATTPSTSASSTTIDAPFVGDGFTRWVDGQYALDRPELGLSNWQSGRLFGRGGILSGDAVFTVRARVTQTDPDLAR